MKYNKFDVVQLKNGNRATILDITQNGYLGEIVNIYGITIETRDIADSDIQTLIFTKNCL